METCPCPHCGVEFTPCSGGAVRDKCARCYGWARRHPGRPIPPRGQPRSRISGPLRVSFCMTLDLKRQLDEHAAGNLSAYIRQAVEERLARDNAGRARAAGFTPAEESNG